MEAFSTSPEWTSSAEASRSRARTSASPAAGPDWPENARVFGGSSLGSLGNYDPATSSLRTSQLSLLEDSMSCLRTLPRAGSMRSGTIYQRRPLAPLTGETGSGSLPTPTTKHNMLSPSMDKRSQGHRNIRASIWPTPAARDHKDTGENVDYDKVAKKSKLAGVVQVRERNWPTPTARLGAQRGSQAKRYHDPARSNDLDDAVAASGSTGSLNPTWVEWLMGFPLGWTDLEV